MRKKFLFFFYQIRYLLQTFRLIIQIFIKHVLFSESYQWKRYFWDRLGIFSKEIQKIVEGKNCIWLQAISEGDVIALPSFLASIRKILPKHKIIFSTNNHGSFKMLNEMVNIDGVIYFPWDIGFICQRALNIINPEFYIVIQHDYCWNFIKEVKRRGVKSAIISGSIRPGEMPEYDSFYYKRAFLGNFLKFFDYIGVQTVKDLKIFIKLGANKNKVFLVGSMKMDLSYADIGIDLRDDILNCLNIEPAAPVIIAGSTHETEEEIILEAYNEIRAEIPNMKLIIVPRYIERSSQIRQISENMGFNSKIVTELTKKNKSCDVYIIKMFGILSRLYAISTFVFLGGSLIPRGGQNILEPMYHGKPIFFGPYMEHRKEFCNKLKEIWDGLEIINSRQLAQNVILLFKNPNIIRSFSVIAKKIIAEGEESIITNTSFLRKILINRQMKN